MVKFYIFSSLFFLSISQNALCQDSSELLTLDVGKIINLPDKFNFDQEIVSASKKSERLFDAPLSASVLTKEEIDASGATSIMEALRLLPGLIVRQMTNGTYNVQIRGMDWLPKNNTILSGLNQLALVMIDDRPVYSYSFGFTLWNSLPIQLSDIERIELVRGPSASLFGPNAVTGVINIITTDPKREKIQARANISLGSFNSSIADISVGYRFNKKLALTASAHKAYRERTTTEYYDLLSGQYQDLDNMNILPFYGVQLEDNNIDSYQDTEEALNKQGLNLKGTYSINDKDYVELSTGYTNSANLETFFLNSGTPFARTFTENIYGYLNSKIWGFKLNLSYLNERLDPAQGLFDAYNNDLLDATINYDWRINDFLNISSSLGYRYADYKADEKENYDIFSLEEAFNAISDNLDASIQSPELALDDAISRTFQPPFPLNDYDEDFKIENPSFSLRADSKLLGDRLRLVAAFRSDRFSNLSDKIYNSYQFSTTYSLSERQIIRGRIAKSYASQYLANTQAKGIQPTVLGSLTVINEISGNPNLDPVSQELFELGYRLKYKDNFSFDTELFHGILTDQSSIIAQGLENTGINGIPLIGLKSSFVNIPMRAKQTGATFSMNYYQKKLSFKTYITFQSTSIEGYSSSIISPDIVALTGGTLGTQSYVETEDASHVATPTWFGGFHLQIKPHQKFEIGVNCYYLTDQTLETNDGGPHDIGNKVIGNIKLGYKPVSHGELFISVRDITNNQIAEYYFTDPIRTSFWLGLRADLK